MESARAKRAQRFTNVGHSLNHLLTLLYPTIVLTLETEWQRSYAELIRRLNYDPEFFRPRPTTTEAQWLTQRVATTHDIHHVVSGFGTMAAGESGVLAITAAQIGFPAYVLLTTAGQLASFRFQIERFEAISRAVGHGHAIARQASCLAAARWEEGWKKPVNQWRLELGLSDPADHESYGLAAQLP